MKFEKLSTANIEQYIEYLKLALSEEPDKMTAEEVEVDKLKERILDPFYMKTISILAFDEDKVVGRIEFHFYGCMQDGCRMAYVDWVYVLKAYRHQGIAQRLFQEFEQECYANNIDQYYLITAKNEEASRFYSAFDNVKIESSPILRKLYR